MNVKGVAITFLSIHNVHIEADPLPPTFNYSFFFLYLTMGWIQTIISYMGKSNSP